MLALLLAANIAACGDGMRWWKPRKDDSCWSTDANDPKLALPAQKPTTATTSTSIYVTPGPAGSPEYVRGWCDAAKAVWANRNHNRALMGYAPETQAKAMKRIYKKWPADPPAMLPGHHPWTDFVGDALKSEMDAIDLYVVLPQCDWNPGK